MEPEQYLQRFKTEIERRYQCSASHLHSEAVSGSINGSLTWNGTVEVFALEGHPTASRCFGWSYTGSQVLMTSLGVPPIHSAKAAVEAQLAAEENGSVDSVEDNLVQSINQAKTLKRELQKQLREVSSFLREAKRLHSMRAAERKSQFSGPISKTG